MDASQVLNELIERHPRLDSCRDDIWNAYGILYRCYEDDGFLFTCGNGGSAADADHIVGEILKGFVLRRPLSESERKILRGNGQPEREMLADKLQCGLRAMNLMAQPSIMSAAANDLGGDTGPAQQLNALGRKGDILLGISTSGNAVNVAMACQVARLRGMKVIGLSGAGGGRLADLADVCIRVPEKETFKVQELHLPVYHALCMMVECTFFRE